MAPLLAHARRGGLEAQHAATLGAALVRCAAGAPAAVDPAWRAACAVEELPGANAETRLAVRNAAWFWAARGPGAACQRGIHRGMAKPLRRLAALR